MIYEGGCGVVDRTFSKQDTTRIFPRTMFCPTRSVRSGTSSVACSSMATSPFPSPKRRGDEYLWMREAVFFLRCSPATTLTGTTSPPLTRERQGGVIITTSSVACSSLSTSPSPKRRGDEYLWMREAIVFCPALVHQRITTTGTIFPPLSGEGQGGVITASLPVALLPNGNLSPAFTSSLWAHKL